MGADLFDTLVQGKGFQSDHRSKLRQGLIGPHRPAAEPEPVSEAGQQQKLKQYFEDYDRKHRPKTLLELHQEKNRAEKGMQIEDNSFNREDMGYSKVDSRSVFKIVSAAGANLTAKFADGKFKNTFV